MESSIVGYFRQIQGALTTIRGLLASIKARIEKPDGDASVQRVDFFCDMFDRPDSTDIGGYWISPIGAPGYVLKNNSLVSSSGDSSTDFGYVASTFAGETTNASIGYVNGEGYRMQNGPSAISRAGTFLIPYNYYYWYNYGTAVNFTIDGDQYYESIGLDTEATNSATSANFRLAMGKWGQPYIRPDSRTYYYYYYYDSYIGSIFYNVYYYYWGYFYWYGYNWWSAWRTSFPFCGHCETVFKFNRFSAAPERNGTIVYSRAPSYQDYTVRITFVFHGATYKQISLTLYNGLFSLLAGPSGAMPIGATQLPYTEAASVGMPVIFDCALSTTGSTTTIGSVPLMVNVRCACSPAVYSPPSSLSMTFDTNPPAYASASVSYDAFSLPESSGAIVSFESFGNATTGSAVLWQSEFTPSTVLQWDEYDAQHDFQTTQEQGMDYEKYPPEPYTYTVGHSADAYAAINRGIAYPFERPEASNLMAGAENVLEIRVVGGVPSVYVNGYRYDSPSVSLLSQKSPGCIGLVPSGDLLSYLFKIGKPQIGITSVKMWVDGCPEPANETGHGTFIEGVFKYSDKFHTPVDKTDPLSGYIYNPEA